MPQWPWKNPRPGVDEYGRNALWHHALEGNIEALRADLRAGLSPTSPDKDGNTALHVAVQGGHADAVALLIQAGGDVNATDKHGNGPLWTAGYEASKATASEARVSIVTMLLKAGADPHHKNRADRTPERWREVSPKVDVAFAAA